jgi:hypothetical protein
MGKAAVNGEINRLSPIVYPYSTAIITGPCVHLNHPFKITNPFTGVKGIIYCNSITFFFTRGALALYSFG